MLAHLAAAVAQAYTPDDGTLGYTPYYYKMDVPVRVRNSISYGRAWQLLRSRGAESNATGNCDPPQLATSCNCSTTTSWPTNIGVRDRDDIDRMPRCLPSSLCGQGPRSTESGTTTTTPTVASSAAILLIMDMQKENLRFPIGNCDKCLRNGYRKMVREVVRCLISLRAVSTALPVHLLVSGFRHAPVEDLLEKLYGVRVLDAAKLATPPVVVPAWASKWARGSFAKLRALTLTQFEQVIVLDADDIVLRNIDHLARNEAPAFVFGWKCYPRRELRAATMVLRPSLSDWQRALRLVDDPRTAVYDDLGEQSVWRQLYSSVYELPAGYAAMRTADLPAAEWSNVHIVHDAHLIHDVQRRGWHEALMTGKVVSVDKQASKVVDQNFAPLFAQLSADLAAAGKAGGRRRGSNKRGRKAAARARMRAA